MALLGKLIGQLTEIVHGGPDARAARCYRKS
jgi:hypothetical protein